MLFRLLLFSLREHDAAQDDDHEREDGEAEHFRRVGEIGTDERQRAFAAAARYGYGDESGERDADDGFADDESRGEERTAAACRFALFRPAIFQHLVEHIAKDSANDERSLDARRQ